MNSLPFSKDIAVRIALAARLLPGMDAKGLLKILDRIVGLPPSKKKLEKLKREDLFAAYCELYGNDKLNVDSKVIVGAVRILSGAEPIEELRDKPNLDDYMDGDMPGSIRVACASNNGEDLDGHFGSCKSFLIYQVSKDEIRLVDVRSTKGPQARDEKNVFRTALIEDCLLLFVVSIGGPAAAKVVKAGIHPIKYPAGGGARSRIQEIQKILINEPPPWLAKAIGQRSKQQKQYAENRPGDTT